MVLREPVETYGGPPFELGSSTRSRTRLYSLAAILDHRQRVLSNPSATSRRAAALTTYKAFLTTDARPKKVLASMNPGDISLVPGLNTVQEISHSRPAPFW